MKFLIAFSLTLLITQPAFSTLIPCETQIKTEVSNWIEEDLTVNAVRRSFQFGEHSVYDVIVGLDLEEGEIGIPYAAYYKILVKDLGQGACVIVDAALESEAY